MSQGVHTARSSSATNLSCAPDGERALAHAHAVQAGACDVRHAGVGVHHEPIPASGAGSTEVLQVYERHQNELMMGMYNPASTPRPQLGSQLRCLHRDLTAVGVMHFYISGLHGLAA